MLESIEITAANVEDATIQAANKLGVTLDQVEVEVLEEIRKLFGRRQVRVKASVKKISSSETVESTSKLQEDAADGEKEGSGIDADTVEKVVSLAKEFFVNSGLTADVKLKNVSGKYVHLELDGKDVSFLIGKYGNGINGLQYLLNKITSKRIGSFVRVVLDGNNFRNKREQALKKLASSIAKEVKQRKEEAVLDAMPAFDRRVVHQALQSTKGINTYSEGEEPHRRLVIAPKDSQ